MNGSADFYQAVYAIVARIPPGRVATYGQIALLAGRPRGARAVGYAMRVVPEGRDLPCHRVVSRSGRLAPAYAFGGSDRQRQMLEDEGVSFLPGGRVNMGRSLWRPR